MRSFKVVDGDLSVGAGRYADMVSGTDKLLQDLSLWLCEPLGTGITTPYFGSTLPQMVGEDDPSKRLLDVKSEIQRILGLYQANQIERLREDRDNGQLTSWSKSEILNSIDSVNVVQANDGVSVTVEITTAAGSALAIEAYIDEEGVAV